MHLLRTHLSIIVAAALSIILVGAAIYFSSARAQIVSDVVVTEEDLTDIARCLNPLCTGDECGSEFFWPPADIGKDTFNNCSGANVEVARILNCDPRTRIPDPDPDGTCEYFIGDELYTAPAFGFVMETAVKELQSLYSLPVTGIIDSSTRNLFSTLTSDFSTAYDLLLGTLGGGFLGGTGPPFGGMVELVQPCTCSPGVVVLVGPPRGGPFLYVPGATQVFEYFQIPKVGVWLLGIYSPGATCLIWSGKICVPAPIQPWGTIIMTGTSF